MGIRAEGLKDLSDQELLEGFLVESNQNRLADSHRGSSEVARGAEHGVDGFFGNRASRLELTQLLALGDDQFRRSLGHCTRIFAAELLARRHDFFGLDLLGIQKLGGSRA